jgi:hypothetical protein
MRGEEAGKGLNGEKAIKRRRVFVIPYIHIRLISSFCLNYAKIIIELNLI